MEIKVAESWHSLQKLLFHDAWNPSLARYRSPYAFRGLSDANYGLDNTLKRLGGDYVNLEHHLIRNFKKYAHRDIVSSDSIWHWISVAQHHGLPTRLLDWTHSPLIAMHFATANMEKFCIDGAIWSLNYEKAHDYLPRILREQLNGEGANTFTTEMLNRATQSLSAFSSISTEPMLLFFEPPSMDDRIINQFALFSVMSDSSLGVESWLSHYPDLCRKIIIPAEIKWEIRDKLDQCNITERVIFPGLDGLSRWLQRHYSQNNSIR